MQGILRKLAILFAAGTAVAQPPTPPATPISKPQLEKLLVLEQSGDEQTAASIHAQLEQKRATLPAWFPKAVWDDVERKVEAIRYADVVLPVYQKYMSSDQAETEMLIYQGPTGQKIALMEAGRAEAVGQTGLRGSAADEQVSATLKNTASFQDLMRERLGEMTPDQRAKVQAAIPEMRAVTPRIDDEAHEAYRKRSNEVVQATIAAHSAELAKAQQAAGRH